MYWPGTGPVLARAGGVLAGAGTDAAREVERGSIARAGSASHGETRPWAADSTRMDVVVLIERLPLTQFPRLIMHLLLFYEAGPNYLERRAPYRAEHLELIREATERGELLMAGAFANPADGAVLVFRGDSSSAAEAFARADPYVRNGVVAAWRVREWTVVTP